MGNGFIKLNPLSFLIITLIAGVIVVSNLGTEALGGVIGGLVVAVVAAGIPWIRNRWGLFELRFLDPQENPHPKKERRSTVVSLSTGRSIVRFSLRPRTDISLISRFQFTAFDNQDYPQRFLPGSTGQFVPASEIVVEKFSRRNDDGTWTDYGTLIRDEQASYVDGKFLFYEGSRQVFEIVYNVSDSRQGWDGILGFQVQFQQSGNNKTRNVNSKAFVGRLGHRPLTFTLRRVQETESVTL